MNNVITRFAPSPTGKLHLGNARTALICWLFARQQNGKFILRIDDSDRERSKDEYTAAIKKDLTWLGLTWDELHHQAQRLERYTKVIEDLKANGHVYPCYETSEELSLKRKTRLAQGKPPVYDRAGLQLTATDRAKLESEGRKPHWRFRLQPGNIEWQDEVRGPVKFRSEDLSDPVVIREDGNPLYHLCSVIDDWDMGVTHVVRGEDHVTNTACHIQMLQALGSHIPQFAHLALFADAEGHKLSKRIGSLSIETLQAEGYEPMAILSLLGKLGTSDPIAIHPTLADLAKDFSFKKFSRTAAKLDARDMDRLNEQLLHQLNFADVQEKLAAAGFDQVDEALWLAVRKNLTKLSDIKIWLDVIYSPIAPVMAEPEYLAQALAAVPAEINAESWHQLTKILGEQTGRKGKALFMPLRQALTGMDHGPEMGPLLPLLGAARIKARLAGQTA